MGLLLKGGHAEPFPDLVHLGVVDGTSSFPGQVLGLGRGRDHLLPSRFILDVLTCVQMIKGREEHGESILDRDLRVAQLPVVHVVGAMVQPTLFCEVKMRRKYGPRAR